MKNIFILLVLFIASARVLMAQNSMQKIKESQENTMREIEYANKLLIETQGKTKESLNEINIINHKLLKRREYLTGLEVEVTGMDQAIATNEQEIGRIEQEIKRIEKVYAMMITNLYKSKSESYQVMYFLASENLNQMYKRVRMVKIYYNYLKKERNELEGFRKELVEKNNGLVALKENKNLLVNKTKNETVVIQKEISEKNILVSQLKLKQKEIEQEIKEKERTARKLENELKKIIDEERRRSKNNGTSINTTPEDRLLSSDFEKNMGKLPWPTMHGIITGKYGEHQHPDYKNVIIRNDGVYISTATGEIVRAVFKGVISRVFTIPGENYTVIIKHGQFYTLYHNLINVRVKAGQTVNTKDVIGTVFTDGNTKETILYFQIWKETEKKDPELWLAPL